MAAIWAMHLTTITTMGYRMATIRVGIRYFNCMLVIMVTVWMMQVAIMNIIDVITMLDGRMTTTRTMGMFRVFMDLTAGHTNLQMQE